ncbi:MAG: phosphoribosylformylglycinamidine synthase [Clostridiales bacterium]|jgi:phosphoribosylformylglycinamidine synthase|nr:phosphoribosylformylglycinamidine synthase [Clostridiales bacterium]
MVYRIFVEKKEGFAGEAAALESDIKTLLGISGLKGVRVINRYDAENIDEALFEDCRWKVFAEPQLDNTASELEGLPFQDVAPEDAVRFAASVFAVEALPGQFDQRADSAEQCIQIISQGERPVIRFARVYLLYGDLSEQDIQAVKKYVINPVETREARLEKPETLEMEYEIPETVETLQGFTTMVEQNLSDCIAKMGLAMDEADLAMCVEYFRDVEQRDPTITELRMIDTYWSDHCRHTTFNTIIDSVTFEDIQLERAYRDYLAVRKELGRDKPVTLMDIATMAVRYLKRNGKLDKLDESEEINACTVKINVEVDGENEPWLLLFKNETHNHPTEIEPFGGAATCLGGCIRDPLSGRAYAYSAMRVTGAADPLQPVSETLPGKLPQRSITTTAARGYSSYGNQIGLCTGQVDEIYHPGYAAKRMEVGAVMAAAPAVNVRRVKPEPGDVIMLLGGSTGRDGIGGATGSSKAHDTHSVETCGAEVQKGNAPEERKIQRLFRNATVTRMIKKCNDFGAGGVSVAIGELADGLEIDLDAVPKKYEGLDGTELAISESQERMACVIDAENEDFFKLLASDENLQCVRVATVTEEPRLVMNWNGQKIVDISREFLDSNGADKHIEIAPANSGDWQSTCMYAESRSFSAAMHNLAQDLNTCSKRGLSERFDSTIGAGTVLMPFGGKNQITPIQAMVHKIPLEEGYTDDCSLMAWGYNPFISSASPYHGAYLAVVESVAKLIATGASFKDVYLSFQEYFESPRRDPARWGKPLAALLGAFEAQMGLGIGSIGGKDSMSGSFEDIDVPPTLISFATTMGKTGEIVSPEFKKAGHRVVILRPELESENGGVGRDLPNPASLIKVWNKAYELISSGEAVSAYTPGIGGIAEAIMKMSFGNGFGFRYEAAEIDERLGNATNRYAVASHKARTMKDIFGYNYGSIILELGDEAYVGGGDVNIETLGYTTSGQQIVLDDEVLEMSELLSLYEGKLESVFPTTVDNKTGKVENISFRARSWHAPIYKRTEPRVLIPVFPGTNCEYDSARAVREAGGVPEIMIIKNRSSEDIKNSVERFARSLKDAQMIFIPGGFSGGDEPDGSAKFITAFFRNEEIKEGVTALLDKKDGLMCGVCNGFQALIKLGLVPYGRIIDTDENCPTLTNNVIGSHQSKIVRVRIASNKSPWLRYTEVGQVYSVPISHGEGRFIAPDETIRHLAATGQIATQYVDLDGNATGDIRFNPNGSMMAVEGITSPDGRVFGKMGHAERVGKDLYKNVEGKYFMGMFESAVKYFK